MMKRGLTDLVGDGFDLFRRWWKPLMFGFAVTNLAGSAPMVVADFLKSRLYDALKNTSQNTVFNDLRNALPSLAVGLGIILGAVILYALVYNYGYSLAHAALRQGATEDFGELNQVALKRYWPMMSTVALFALAFVVPAAFLGGAIIRGAQLFSGGSGWSFVILMVMLALFSAFLSVPILLLSIAVPSATETFGAESFKRGLDFVRSHFLELCGIAAILVLLALFFGLLSTALQAPFPSGESGPSFGDLMNVDPGQLTEKMFGPEVRPLWARIGAFIVDTTVYSIRVALSVCIVTAWFSDRTRQAR